MDNQNKETIMNIDDVLHMLDGLLEKWDAQWWDEFWSDKEKPIPFFVDLPDESLVKYIDDYDITVGKAMDIGCGNGRNSRYLASKGFEIEGIDFSKECIDWPTSNDKAYPSLSYINESFFDIKKDHHTYDFIYDSGCLHHIKPHRRIQYLKKVANLLKPGGYFALVCFNEKGGNPITDYDVYRKESMAGGLGYSEEKLSKVLIPFFDIVEFREMEDGEEDKTFGQPTLWTVLLRKGFHQ